MKYLELDTELVATRTRTNTHPYDTKASTAGRRGGLRVAPARTKDLKPYNAAATRQSAVLSVVYPIKGPPFVSLCIFLAWCTAGVSQKLTRCKIAILHLLLTLELGQG